MIRYNKHIRIARNPTGAYTITGDRSSVGYRTSAINGYEQIGVWWERQHHSTLREYQKDLLVKLLPSAFKSLDYSWCLTPYVVYAEGAGYNQPHDIVFATLTHPQHNTIYLLGTQEHTWVQHEKATTDRFNCYTQDAYASVDTPQGQDTVWQLYDDVRKIAT